ncbi:MAG: apolipoprotein N-acyltransferase, partial [Candidatus Neomarinimicrobiota bacterium]|nr:apolipoprotein N-acyltransferase [Candidatus Neomarinimicrobiota bacterium]
RINQLNTQSWEDIEVAALQPNINPNEKWEPTYRKTLFSIMDSLNNKAYDMKPKLVLWPEAALPVYMRVSSAKQAYENKVRKTSIPLIMGTVDFKRDTLGRKVFNGSIYFGLNENKIYHKLLLVPFAEYIPLSNKFTFLNKLNFGQANFTHGNEFTVFQIDTISFSNMICYESSHPSIARGFINNGARFLTIQANDAWLQNSSGVRQHFELARLRAVELRTGIIRSANTGISGIIDPSGRVKHKVKFYDQEVFKGKILLNKSLTFYARFGNLFSIICFVLVLIQGVYISIRKKQ